MQIPSILYDRYDEAMALFLDTANFGTSCKLVYNKVSTLSATPLDVRKRLTLSPPVGQNGSIRGTESTSVVETTENVTLRVYQDKKSFTKIGAFDFVEGSCMTIGPLSLMDNIKRANFILIHSARNSEQKYEKGAEPLIWGLNGNYVVAYWKRI